MPKAKALVAPAPEVVTRNVQINEWIPVTYPPDASNYIWSVEQSLDMVHWTPLPYHTTGMSYDARCHCATNLVYFARWAPSTNNNFDVTMGTNRVVFWRLHGYKQ